MAWFGDKTYLGAEIGTTTIKLVELVKSGKEIRISFPPYLQKYPVPQATMFSVAGMRARKALNALRH